MGAVRTFNITVADDIANDIDAAVASGAYATSGEVIREALRLWRRDLDADKAETVRLRALWEEGLASGEPVELTGDWFEDIKRRGRAQLAAMKAAE